MRIAVLFVKDDVKSVLRVRVVCLHLFVLNHNIYVT